MKKESFGSPFLWVFVLRLGWAARCSPQHFLRLQDRAPPARRFAGQARSHICFGPVPLVPARADPLSRANTTGLIGTKQM